MADVKFYCPGCRAKLSTDARAAGYVVRCPHCGAGMKVPAPKKDPDKKPSRGPTHPGSPERSGENWRNISLTREEIEFLSRDTPALPVSKPSESEPPMHPGTPNG
jgi:hypothetical protein